MERRRERMQRHTPLGYQIIDGKAEIIPETAQIVTAVFREYLNGTSTFRIARNLTEQGVLNASHKLSWNHGSVGKILENVKYMGDSFYPPLIKKSTFEQVQRRRLEKAEALGRTIQLNSFANAAVWSGRLYCGVCGEPYRRYVEHCGQAGETVRWKCKHYMWKNGVFCRNIFLTDDQMETAFVRIINRVIANLAMLETHPPCRTAISSPASERLTGEIQQALQTGQYTAGEIKRLIFERAVCQYQSAVADDWQYQTNKLGAALCNREEQVAFNERLFAETVKKAVVHEDGRLQFTMLNGLRLETNISEKKEAYT